jgi:hypothetical protein
MFILAFAWGVLMLVSFIGWGFLLNLLLGSDKKMFLGLKAAVGLSLIIFFGGILNLFGLITRQILLSILGAGVFFCLYLFWVERGAVASKIKTLFGIWKLKRPYSILVILLSLFILFQYSLTVFNKQFHGYDDYQTYLAFPEKMIQNGSLGVDPYAETRVVTSLGGKYFLDTFVLTVLPLNSLHIIDSGVAYLILILLVVGILRVWKIQWPLTLFLVFAVSLITAPSGNVTSMVTSIVVFLALCLFLFKEEFWGNSWLKNSLVFALLFSAFFALKSNTIPIAGLLFLGFFAVCATCLNKQKNLHHALCLLMKLML